MVIVRPYQNKDHEQYKRIMEAVGLNWKSLQTKEALEEKVEDDPGSVIVAEENKLVGAVNTYCNPSLSSIYFLAVDPSWQGKGIGKRLLKSAEEHIYSHGWKNNNIQLFVNGPDIKELEGFYRKAGYMKTNHAYMFLKHKL
ncbi:MAG: GNAT family N-acetyltransferase [Nanobdellota archaeon]